MISNQERCNKFEMTQGNMGNGDKDFTAVLYQLGTISLTRQQPVSFICIVAKG